MLIKWGRTPTAYYISVDGGKKITFQNGLAAVYFILEFTLFVLLEGSFRAAEVPTSGKPEPVHNGEALKVS